jgi:D-3-phosphoglycerate dehydrogenase
METNVLVTPRSFAVTSPKPIHMLEEAYCQVIRLERPTDDIITTEIMIEAARGVQAIIIGIEPLNRAVLEHAPDLRVISKYGVGMDNIDIEAARSRGIALGWTPGANSNAVAEMTLGLMFALARSIPQSDRAMHDGRFERARGFELHGRVLGVIGLGRIGVRVAKAASCLGMRVLAYDPYLGESPMAGIPLVDLSQLYQEADVISLHLPLTEQTRHMIDAQVLSAMKPDALLINTARGGIVDEGALYDALQAGELGGAAIDCFSQEPAYDSPLLKLKQVVGTPHTASHTQEASEAMGSMAAENAIAGLQGKALPYPFEGPSD